MTPGIEMVAVMLLNAAARCGVAPVCADVTSGEDDQCAGVVINAIITWSME